MFLADVGVNRVPPGFARPGCDASNPLLDRAASRVPANPVDDPDWRTGRGLGGPLGGQASAPIIGPGHFPFRARWSRTTDGTFSSGRLYGARSIEKVDAAEDHVGDRSVTDQRDVNRLPGRRAHRNRPGQFRPAGEIQALAQEPVGLQPLFLTGDPWFGRPGAVGSRPGRFH